MTSKIIDIMKNLPPPKSTGHDTLIKYEWAVVSSLVSCTRRNHTRKTCDYKNIVIISPIISPSHAHTHTHTFLMCLSNRISISPRFVSSSSSIINLNTFIYGSDCFAALRFEYIVTGDDGERDRHRSWQSQSYNQHNNNGMRVECMLEQFTFYNRHHCKRCIQIINHIADFSIAVWRVLFALLDDGCHRNIHTECTQHTRRSFCAKSKV